MIRAPQDSSSEFGVAASPLKIFVEVFESVWIDSPRNRSMSSV